MHRHYLSNLVVCLSNVALQTMWLERTIVNTTSALPGILRWCEVNSSCNYNMSPIEVAIDTMLTMNKSLESLFERCQGNDSARVNVSQLTMKLKGVIDAEVMGGLAVYHQVS